MTLYCSQQLCSYEIHALAVANVRSEGIQGDKSSKELPVPSCPEISICMLCAGGRSDMLALEHRYFW